MAIKKNLTNGEQVVEQTGEQVANSNALIEVNGTNLTPDQLINVTADKFLPRLKVVYPVEVDPDKGIMPKHGYQTMIQIGSRFLEVPDNTYMFGLAARDVCRANTVEIDGKRVRYDEKNEAHKKIGGKFELVYGPLKNMQASDEYQAALRSDLYDRGVSWLVAVFMKTDDSNGCMVCELNGFKSMSSYWNIPFQQACVRTGRALLLKQANHCYNLATGKNYLDPKKFNQYAFEPLTAEQINLRDAAWVEQAPEIKNWLSK